MFLYHVTDRKNLESIKKSGLIVNPPRHAYENEIGIEALKDKVFLALNAGAAEAYAECSDECPEEIVILKVELRYLDESKIEYDWNNRCEYYEDINSVVYRENIPSNCLQECKLQDEPAQDIHTFKGTAMYENVLNIFDEQCETNLENTRE